jgi:hypothetical protein
MAEHPLLLRSFLDVVEQEGDWEQANLAIIEAGKALRDDRHRGRSRQLGRKLWKSAARTVWAGRRMVWEIQVADELLDRFWNAEAKEMFSLSHPKSPWSKSGLPQPPRMPGAARRAQQDPVRARILARLQHALAWDAVGIASQGLVPERTNRDLRRPLARIMAAVIEEQGQSTSLEKLSETELRTMANDAAYHLQEAQDWATGASLTSGNPGTGLDEQELTIIRPSAPGI